MQIGLTATSYRTIRTGAEYNHLFDTSNFSDDIVQHNSSVDDVVTWAGKVVASYSYQTKALAMALKKESPMATLRNIWEFAYNHIQYRLDRPGMEQLRTPARTWADRRSGVDCDDYTIFIASLLYNLQIPFKFRIAEYDHKGYYQHIYPIALLNGKEIPMDAVIDQFNFEKQFSSNKDFSMTKLGISGLDVHLLGGAASENPFADMVDVVMGNDLKGFGLGAADDDQMVLNYLIKTRDTIAKKPGIIASVQTPSESLRMLNYAIDNWNTPNRNRALDILEDEEEKLILAGAIQLHGLENDPDIPWETEAFSGLAGTNEEPGYLYDYSEMGSLGSRKKKEKNTKGFFNKVKNATKKVGGGVKKVAKAVVRFNPVSLAAKGGVLLLVGKNFRGIADKMQYGLLSRSEAEKLNLDMAAWEQHKAAYDKAVKLYSTILQGDKNKLDEAIKKGRKKPINGLGSVAVVASSAAAATPFIVKMFNFFKGLKSPEKAALIAEHGKKEGKALYKAQKKANGGGILKNLLNKQLAPQSTVPANSSEDEAMDESLAPGVDTSKSSFMAPVVTWAKNNKLLVGGIVVAGTILAVPTLRNGVAGIFTGKGKGKSKSPQARSLGSTPHKKKTVRKSKMKKTFKIH